jgi:hypothetical protein
MGLDDATRRRRKRLRHNAFQAFANQVGGIAREHRGGGLNPVVQRGKRGGVNPWQNGCSGLIRMGTSSCVQPKLLRNAREGR